jgi:hypothetical protein
MAKHLRDWVAEESARLTARVEEAIAFWWADPDLTTLRDTFNGFTYPETARGISGFGMPTAGVVLHIDGDGNELHGNANPFEIGTIFQLVYADARNVSLEQEPVDCYEWFEDRMNAHCRELCGPGGSATLEKALQLQRIRSELYGPFQPRLAKILRDKIRASTADLEILQELATTMMDYHLIRKLRLRSEPFVLPVSDNPVVSLLGQFAHMEAKNLRRLTIEQNQRARRVQLQGSLPAQSTEQLAVLDREELEELEQIVSECLRHLMGLKVSLLQWDVYVVSDHFVSGDGLLPEERSIGAMDAGQTDPTEALWAALRAAQAPNIWHPTWKRSDVPSPPDRESRADDKGNYDDATRRVSQSAAFLQAMTLAKLGLPQGLAKSEAVEFWQKLAVRATAVASEVSR